MVPTEQFILLLDKYITNEISPADRSELLALIASGEYDELVSQHIDKKIYATVIEGANLHPHRSAEMLHKILSSEKQNLLLISRPSNKIKMFRIAAAAAVIIGIVLSVYFITNNNNKTAISPADIADNMIEKTNDSSGPLTVRLEDGSVITLQPASAIHYPQHFLPSKREVFLDGEAFFEVSKNPTRPFYVYNKKIVTHVLGTSFTVKLNKETKLVEVSVKSGRVEVYENTVAGKNDGFSKSDGVILLPNQKVIYNDNAHKFIPTLVDKPMPVIVESTEKIPAIENIVFEETPLKTVLPWLEKSFGIEIVAENEDLYKCLFTGDINQQDLYTRLDVVCQATGASYEIKGTKILIKGKGCN
ncbi:MAG: FecR family protein [Chitinophagaceae bacterium]